MQTLYAIACTSSLALYKGQTIKIMQLRNKRQCREKPAKQNIRIQSLTDLETRMAYLYT